MRDGIAWISFTERGQALAGTLAARLGGEVSRGGDGFSMRDWTEAAFASRAALVFVGAAGIAVRAVAPFLKSKAEDPAVVAVDETGQYVIPLLSGHLGGANALAEKIAAATRGTAVITTATDRNGIFAVDLWAKRQNMTVLQPERIKKISAALLRGETVRVSSRWPVSGEAPANVTAETDPDAAEQADVLVDDRDRETTALQLVPRILTLGIGCRRGIGAEQLEACFERFCRERRFRPEAVRAAASIDLKQDEEGLLRFCREHGWPLRFYSAEALQKAAGSVSSSDFVRAAVGVDNVCERAALLESGGTLAEAKYAGDSVTFALAERETCYDWSW